jgi:hypothetical protein
MQSVRLKMIVAFGFGGWFESDAERLFLIEGMDAASKPTSGHYPPL